MQLSKMPDLQYSNTYCNILFLNIACSGQHKEHHTGDNFGVFLGLKWRCSCAHQLAALTQESAKKQHSILQDFKSRLKY